MLQWARIRLTAAFSWWQVRNLRQHGAHGTSALRIQELHATCSKHLNSSNHKRKSQHEPGQQTITMLEQENEQLWVSLEQARLTAARKAMQQVGCKWGLRLKALSFRKWTQSIRTLLTAQRVASLEAQLVDRGYKALVLGILVWTRWAANTALHHWHLVAVHAKERRKVCLPKCFSISRLRVCWDVVRASWKVLVSLVCTAGCRYRGRENISYYKGVESQI